MTFRRGLHTPQARQCPKRVTFPLTVDGKTYEYRHAENRDEAAAMLRSQGKRVSLERLSEREPTLAESLTRVALKRWRGKGPQG